MAFFTKSPKAGAADYVFLGFLVLLVVFGLVMLTSASSELSKNQFNDSMYHLKHQMTNGVLPGIAGFLIGYFVYYRRWEKAAPFLLIIGILALLLVFTPLALHAKGGDRWVNFGAFSFQPGELMKLLFFVYLSSWISKGQQRGKSFWGGLAPFSILVGLVVLLLLMQPATSTAALIFFTSLLVYFTSGANIKFVAALVLLASLGAIGIVLINPFSKGNYRSTRIQTFLNARADPSGAGYHINQAQTAIGSGGIFGVGFGKSTTKIHYLPEPMGDSIFAVIGEELGFVGAMSFIVLYLGFIWRGLKIARRAGDNFGRYLATSFMCLFGLQAFVNIGAISGVIPMTGIPLPFVSYGGTSLAISLTMCGIVANISRYKRTAA